MRFVIHNTPVDLGAATLGSENLTPNEAGVLEELFKAGGDTVSRLHLYSRSGLHPDAPRAL